MITLSRVRCEREKDHTASVTPSRDAPFTLPRRSAARDVRLTLIDRSSAPSFNVPRVASARIRARPTARSRVTTSPSRAPFASPSRSISARASVASTHSPGTRVGNLRRASAPSARRARGDSASAARGMMSDRAPASPSVERVVSEVYAACERAREVAQTTTGRELRAALDAVEQRARELRTSNLPLDVVTAVNRTVRQTVELGERAVWDAAQTFGTARERVVVAELDAWAEERERKRAERTVSKVPEVRFDVEGELATRDGRQALLALERRFPDRTNRRAPLAGEDDADDRRKRREEVLLKIDETLASMTETGMESAMTVAANVGDGRGAKLLLPIVEWIRSQSDFLRVGIAAALICTFFAIMVIEYLTEENDSSDSLVLSFADNANNQHA